MRGTKRKTTCLALGLLLVGRCAAAYSPVPVQVVSAPSQESLLAMELAAIGDIVSNHIEELAQLSALIANVKAMLKTANEIAALARKTKQAYEMIRNYSIDDLKRDATFALEQTFPELKDLRMEARLLDKNIEGLEDGTFFKHRDYHDPRMQRVLESAASYAFRASIYPVVFPSSYWKLASEPDQVAKLVQYYYAQAGRAHRQSLQNTGMQVMARKLRALVEDAEAKGQSDLKLMATTAQAALQTMENTQFLRDAKELEVAQEVERSLEAKRQDDVAREAFKQHMGDLFRVGRIE